MKVKTVKRTQISHDDFGDAKKYIEAARGHAVDTIEYEALLQAAIIAYARPFSGNELVGRAYPDPPSDPKLDAGVVALNGADRELHARILTLRCKAVAHAESGHYPVEVLPMKPGATIKDGVSMRCQRWNVVREQIDLDAFHRIAQAMIWRCTDHMLDTVFPGSREPTV